MKKETKLFMLICIMYIVTALSIVLAISCIFSILNNIGIPVTQYDNWSLADSLLLLIISGYSIIITILWLTRKI